MTERKDKPMTITDADIERAIQKNLAKLDMLPDVRLPVGMDDKNGAPAGAKSSKS